MFLSRVQNRLYFRKKNGQTIADKRMFVFPEKQFGARTVERGTLLIMNVDMDKDAGLYECYTVTKVEVDGVKQQLLLSSYQVCIVRR